MHTSIYIHVPDVGGGAEYHSPCVDNRGQFCEGNSLLSLLYRV